MKKLVSLFVLMSMFIASVPANAEDNIIDIGATIATDAANWGESADAVEIKDGVLSTQDDVISYNKEKYPDGTFIFDAKVDDSVVWEYEEGSAVCPWFAFAAKHKNANAFTWGGNECAYMIVMKPHIIELQRWVGSTTEMLLIVDNTVATDKEWHSYEFKTQKAGDGVQTALAIDGNIVINYLDTDTKKLTISGYFSFYDWLEEGPLLVREFEGAITDMSALPSEETEEPAEEKENVPAEETEKEPEEQPPVSQAPEYKIYPADDVKVLINGAPLEMQVKPVIVNDRVLVPFRAIFEAMGAEVEWEAETRTVRGTKRMFSVEFIIDGSNCVINGAPRLLDTPAIIVNDRTLVPVRVVAEGLNANVDWDDATRTVIINDK